MTAPPPSLPRLEAQSVLEGGVRWYMFPDGRRYPSVTAVLNLLARPALDRWRMMQALEAARQVLMGTLGRPLQPETVDLALEEALRRPDALRDGAARWGSGIHRYIETGEVDKAPRHLQRGLTEALKFIEGLNPLARFSEHLVVSDALQVAGRLDLALWTARGWTLLDIKTGQPRLEHRLQLGGYSACIAEATGCPVTAAYLVRLPRDGRPLEVHPVDGLPRWQEAFGHLAQLFWLLRGVGEGAAGL